MPSTYSDYKIELIGTGEQSGTWGTTTNTNLGTAIEQAIGGYVSVAFTGLTKTLTLANTNAAQDARALYLNLTGSPGGAATLELPAIQKSYIIKNNTTGGNAVTAKVSGMTGVVIPNGSTMMVYNNGTDVVVSTDNFNKLGIGSSNLTGINLRISQTLTGATNAYSILNQPTVLSDVTNATYNFFSSVVTQAAAFTIPNVYHFAAQSASIGAGSSITSQYGFVASSTLTQATNNFGFYGDIASGANRWNFYAAGTANNYMAGSLGIGTTSLSGKLDVRTPAGTAAVQNLETGSSAAAASLRIAQTGSVGWLTGLTATAGDYQISIESGQTAYTVTRSGNNVANHIFSTSASERMRIDSSGRMMVGFTASKTFGGKVQAAETLDVIGASAASLTGIGVCDYDALDSTPTYKLAFVRKYGPSAVGNLYVASSIAVAGWAEFGATNSSGVAFGTNNATPIVFGTTAAERMRIDSSGNVGIGVTPTSKLHVQGTGETTAPTVSGSKGATIYAVATNNVSDAGGGIEFGGKSGQTFSAIKAGITDGASNGIGYLSFYTRANTTDSAMTERMRIGVDGNVGIGTTTPNVAGFAKALTISAPTQAGYELSSTRPDGAGSGLGGLRWVYETNSAGHKSVADITAISEGGTANQRGGSLVFSTKANASTTLAERMRIDNAGNVGVGTASPDQLLTINSANTSINSLLSYKQGGTTYGYSGLGTDNRLRLDGASVDVGVGTVGAKYVWFYTNNTERMRIDSSGNVTLKASGATNTTHQFIYNENGGEIGLFDNSGNSYSVFDASVTATATRLLHAATTGDLQVGIGSGNTTGSIKFMGANYVERMRIDSSGNVGVGVTPAATVRLQARGSDTTSSNFALYADDSAGDHLFYTRNDGLINTGTRTNSPYNNTTASAANVFVDSSGTLQRSTSSLRYKTDVTDAAHGLADVLKLRSVTYKGKTDGDTVFGGLIAEEVHDAGLTEFVAYDTDGEPDALYYGNMVALAFKAIQEQQQQIDALKAEITALKGG